MRKYELTDEKIIFDGKELFRIKSLRSFSDVKEGDLGGFVYSVNTISSIDDSWVYGDSYVGANVYLSNDSKVYNSKIYNGNGYAIVKSIIKNSTIPKGRVSLCSNRMEYSEVENSIVFMDSKIFCSRIQDSYVSLSSVDSSNIIKSIISSGSLYYSGIYESNLLKSIICNYSNLTGVDCRDTEIGCARLFYSEVSNSFLANLIMEKESISFVSLPLNDLEKHTITEKDFIVYNNLNNNNRTYFKPLDIEYKRDTSSGPCSYSELFKLIDRL